MRAGTVPAEGSTEAIIQRVVYLGFEVRVELVRSDGVVMSVQLARGEAERLRLESGQVVHARPSRQKLFEQAAESKPALVA